MIDAVAAWEIEERYDRGTVMRHLPAECLQTFCFCFAKLTTVPDAGECAAGYRACVRVSLPGCGVGGVMEDVGECVGVVAVGRSQYD
jgi:hypothetical protein